MKKQLILAGFKPVVIGKLIDQTLLNNYSKFLYYKFSLQNKNKIIAEKNSEEDCIFDTVSEQVDKYAVSQEYINKRQVCIFEGVEDFIENEMSFTDISDYPLPRNFKNTENEVHGPKIEARMDWYKKEMKKVFDFFYEEKEVSPENLVHVTCSGYASPSIAQMAMIDRGWLNATVTHSYQMGCYGAFPAMRTANALLTESDTNGRVDIVHTELLSAHLDLTKLSAANSMICSLFSDGFIGYSLFEESKFKNDKVYKNGLRIIAQHEVIIGDSVEDMTWDLGEYNFLMTLSRKVPVFIRKNIKSFLTDLCKKGNIDLEKEKYDLLFAIHPGGPKIIDYIVEELKLFKEQAKWSYAVLKRQGNMSSATIPHIFHDMIEDDSIKPGTKIVAMAFGPGLTATSLLVEKI